MKRLFIDMDGVLAIISDYERENWQTVKMAKGRFLVKEVMPNAQEAIKKLSGHYEMYVLTTFVWNNPDTAVEKKVWLENNFGEVFKQRLILSHNKGILKGDYLIDDTTNHGVKDFSGKHIQFGTEEFPDWNAVLSFLIP